jgi:hypothetical protein
MTRKKADNTCRCIRAWLNRAINKHVGPHANWLRSHISHCPRCQRRLIASGRVHLALSFIKAQPHRLDLLMRANKQAISVLKHSLRQAPETQELKSKLPESKPLEKYGKYGFSIGSLAACLAILILMKIGVFSSMDTVQDRGRKVMKHYYVKQIGEDLADDVFPSETEPASSTNPKDMTTA